MTEYSLVDLRERNFPVYYSRGKTTILNYQAQSISEFLSLRDTISIRYQFFKETKEEIISIVK